MKRSAITILFVLLAVMATAQRMPYGITARSMIAMYPDVKKELKITKDQDKQIQAAMQAQQKEMANGANLPPNFNPSNPMGMMDGILDPILTDEQKARLEQLFIQANGWYAVNDPKVADALGLNDDQKKQAGQIMADADGVAIEKMRGVRSQGAMNNIKKERDKTGEKIKDLLTADQQMKFQDMQGKPYKFKF